MSHLMIELPAELVRRLEQAAERRGQAAGEFAREILQERLGEMPDTEPQGGDAQPKPIWRRFVEAGEALPEDVIKRLPSDGARNLDHYLYGAPKESS
jgi:hypothetical protein